MLTNEIITNALKSVKYPGYSRDIVSFGIVKNIFIMGDHVTVSVQLSAPNPDVAEQLKREAELILQNLPEVKTARVDVSAPTAAPGGAPNPWSGQNKVSGIQRVIAIASGKGGVGKSTVS